MLGKIHYVSIDESFKETLEKVKPTGDSFEVRYDITSAKLEESLDDDNVLIVRVWFKNKEHGCGSCLLELRKKVFDGEDWIELDNNLPSILTKQVVMKYSKLKIKCFLDSLVVHDGNWTTAADIQ